MGSLNDVQELRDVAVVLVPLPIQGHLNPLLHLSAHIATRSIDAHYVCSATHNRQARHRVQGWNLSASSHLQFHDLPFPSLPSPPPTPNPPLSRFPSHLQHSFNAVAFHLLPHLSSLLLSLSFSHRRIVLIHDSSMSFSGAAASSIPIAEAFAFHPASAISNLFFLGQPGLCPASLRACFSEDFFDWVWRQRKRPIAPVAGRLMNTCRCIEDTYLDRLSAEPSFKGQRIFAVGPLHPVVMDGWSKDQHIIRWLDEQPVASVVYVSFGTTSSMSKEQLGEIAAGLEASQQRFIWVRRDADRCDIFEGLGNGEEEDFELVEFQERFGVLNYACNFKMT